MSKCLVTGHKGYIGSKLFKDLKSLGHDLSYRSKIGIGEANCILIKDNYLFGSADSRRGAAELSY